MPTYFMMTSDHRKNVIQASIDIQIVFWPISDKPLQVQWQKNIQSLWSKYQVKIKSEKKLTLASAVSEKILKISI